MGRNLWFFPLILVNTFACASEDGDKISTQLNAKRILNFIPAQCFGHNSVTPVAVRYVRKGDDVPSCGLLLKGGKYMDLVSPEPGESLPACAAPIKAPTYFNVTDSYIVYEYQIEDPRAQFTHTFQLYKINGDRIDACKNDDQITDFAKRTIKTKGVQHSFISALLKFGCIQ